MTHTGKEGKAIATVMVVLIYCTILSMLLPKKKEHRSLETFFFSLRGIPKYRKDMKQQMLNYLLRFIWKSLNVSFF